MLTVKAEIIDVLIGHEERLYKMALFNLGDVQLAMFVHKDTEQTDWIPIQPPKEFEDPLFYNEFTLDLAEMGYILKTKMCTNQ
jgi:hypothetical protein